MNAARWLDNYKSENHLTVVIAESQFGSTKWRVALFAYPPYPCSTFHKVLLKINKIKIATLDALITVKICANEK